MPWPSVNWVTPHYFEAEHNWLPKPNTHRKLFGQAEEEVSACFYDCFQAHMIRVGNWLSLFIGKKPPPRSPRIVDQLRLAVEYQRMLDSGFVASQVQIANAEGISRARVNQILRLNSLPTEIKDKISSLKESNLNQTFLTERSLRVLQNLPTHEEKISAFQSLIFNQS